MKKSYSVQFTRRRRRDGQVCNVGNTRLSTAAGPVANFDGFLNALARAVKGYGMTKESCDWVFVHGGDFGIVISDEADAEAWDALWSKVESL